MGDVDPLLAVRPRATLRDNNCARANIVRNEVCEIIAAGPKRGQDVAQMRHEILTLILQQIEWAQREAITRAADYQLVLDQRPSRRITKN